MAVLVKFDMRSIYIRSRSILGDLLSFFLFFPSPFGIVGLFVQSNKNNVMTYSLYVLRGIFFLTLFLHASTNEVELRKLLFHERRYDEKVCPEAGITQVHTNLILLQIESVNEKEQV